MKQLLFSVIIFAALGGIAAAQVAPSAVVRRPTSEITLQGSGLFARAVTDNGIQYKPTSSGGIAAGYRFYLIRWLAVEGDVDSFRDNQKYTFSNGSLSQRTNVGAATGAVVINLPNPLTKRFQSYFMAGGGAMIFNPRDTALKTQTKNAIVVGGGIDLPVTRHLAIRGQLKTLLYKAPDFEESDLKIDKLTQATVPSVGIVFKF